MPKAKVKRKRKKTRRNRPPRIFVKKGKLYIVIGKKKYLLKDQNKYKKAEIIDIVLKELSVRRKRRSKGKLTKRERKLNKKDFEIFREFEKLNHNQSKSFKLPTGFPDTKAGKSNIERGLYNALLNFTSKLPADVNIQNRKQIEADRKLAKTLALEEARAKRAEEEAKLKIEEAKLRAEEAKLKALVPIPQSARDYDEEDRQRNHDKFAQLENKLNFANKKTAIALARSVVVNNNKKYNKSILKQWIDEEKLIDPETGEKIKKNRSVAWLYDKIISSYGNNYESMTNDFAKYQERFNNPDGEASSVRVDEVEEIPEGEIIGTLPPGVAIEGVPEGIPVAETSAVEEVSESEEDAFPESITSARSSVVNNNKNFNKAILKKWIDDKKLIDPVTGKKILKNKTIGAMYDKIMESYGNDYESMTGDFARYKNKFNNLDGESSEEEVAEAVEEKADEKFSEGEDEDEDDFETLEPVRPEAEEVAEEVAEEEAEESEEAELAKKEVLEQIASGKSYTGTGLTNTEISKMMDGTRGFIGVFPANFNKFLPKKLPRNFSFVMNTDTASGRGEHWIAVRVQSGEEGAVEYYDSFGESPPKSFMKRLKKLIDRLKIPVYLKMKINQIKEQSSNSANCGFHAMKFLLSRNSGQPFRECSGYDDSLKKEKQIETFKKKFEYI